MPAPEYVIIKPSNPRAKSQIARKSVGDTYYIISECRDDTIAKVILDALSTAKITKEMERVMESFRKMKAA